MRTEARAADWSPRSFAHEDAEEANQEFVIKAICVCGSMAGGQERDCLQSGEHLAAFSRNRK